MAKILAIDDERQFCDLLADKIRQMNHEATCAFTMQEGLLKAEVGDYDVVYLDVNLPDGNGLAEINRIKSAPSAPEVIIMTGDGDPADAELAIKSGAWDYAVGSDAACWVLTTSAHRGRSGQVFIEKRHDGSPSRGRTGKPVRIRRGPAAVIGDENRNWPLIRIQNGWGRRGK